MSILMFKWVILKESLQSEDEFGKTQRICKSLPSLYICSMYFPVYFSFPVYSFLFLFYKY